MKKSVAIIMSLMMMFTGVMTGLMFISGCATDEGHEPLSATIIQMEGSVLLQKDGKAVATAVEEGDEIFSGDILTTSADSSAEVEFADESISRVASDSRVVFSDLYQTRDGANVTIINIEPGRIWNSIKELTTSNSRFEVHTPTSVAGVRGTTFSAETGDDGDNFKVFEGEVGVSEGGDDEDDADDLILGQGEEGNPETGKQDIDVLAVDSWEKDNLAEDLPITYIELETEVKTVLIQLTDEKITTYSELRTGLENEIGYYEDLLKGETDSNRREEIQELLEMAEEELELIEELIAELSNDKEVLLQEKAHLEQVVETVKEQSETLDPESLKELVKEEAQKIRQEEKAKEPPRNEQQQKVTTIEEKIQNMEERKIEQAQKAGIDLAVARDSDGQSSSSNDGQNQAQSQQQQQQPDQEPDQQQQPDQEPQPPDPQPDQPGQPDQPQEPQQPEPVIYTVTVTTSPVTSGTVTGGGQYNNGTSVEVRASAAAGYNFLHWSENGNIISEDNVYIFTISGNRNLIATFAIIDAEDPPTEEPPIDKPPTDKPTQPPVDEPVGPTEPIEDPTDPSVGDPTIPPGEPTEDPTEMPTDEPTEPPTEEPTEDMVAIYSISAKYTKVDDSLYLAYVMFAIEGVVNTVTLSANGQSFTDKGVVDGLYRFEKGLSGEPGSIVITIDGEPHYIDVTWVTDSSGVYGVYSDLYSGKEQINDEVTNVSKAINQEELIKEEPLTDVMEEEPINIEEPTEEKPVIAEEPAEEVADMADMADEEPEVSFEDCVEDSIQLAEEVNF